MVDEALERKPLVNVARPVCDSVPVCVVSPLTVRAPRVAICENRFVLDAVVEKKLVVVPAVRERLARVVRPVTLRVEPNTFAPVVVKSPTTVEEACDT